MTACGVTVGFFVLRRCGGPAVTACAQCRRPLCQVHVADAGLCPECALARGYSGHPATHAAHHRRAFYVHSSRTYGDSSIYESLNDFDRAPFDPAAAAAGDYDSDGGSGELVDS